MQDCIIFDIETVVVPELADRYFHPDGPYKPKVGTARQKRDESDAEWAMRKRKIELMDCEVAKERGALYWECSKIISLAYSDPAGGVKCLYDMPEKLLLQSWCDILHRYPTAYPLGKNGSTFDIPFLIGRLLSQDLGLPNQLRKTPKYGTLTDIDHIFGRYGIKSKPLAALAFGIGMDGKAGKATDVHDWYYHEDGPQWDKIVEYNIQDVEICIQLVKRYNRPYKPTKSTEIDTTGLFDSQ